jgi:hypothetical protein
VPALPDIMNLFLAALWHTYKTSQAQMNADNEFIDDEIAHTDKEEGTDEPSTSQLGAPATSDSLPQLCGHGSCNFAPSPQSVKRLAVKLVRHPHFDAFITGLIMLNTAIMMCDGHPISPSFEAFLDDCNVRALSSLSVR